MSGLSGNALAVQVSSDAGPELIDIAADSLEVVKPQCLTIWRGRAEAVRANAHLRADVMRVFSRSEGAGAAAVCGATSRIEAEGSVFYTTATGQRWRGDTGVYDLGGHTITLVGHVVAVDRENVMRGGKVVFNTATGVGRVSGTGKGKGGRPRAIIYPSRAAAPPL